VIRHFSSFEEVIADQDFLASYFGAANEKASSWQQWLSQNPQYKPLVDESILYLNALSITDMPIPSQQVEDAHDRLLHSIEDETPVVKMKHKHTIWWLSAAAAVLIIVTGAVFWKSKDTQLKFTTAYGQVAEYQLPDGSEIMLNANSKLSLKKSWKEDVDREVWLEGEAFFQVKKTTAENRFIVHTGQMDIIVTGTQFNVVNRIGEINVLLKEGSVTLKTANGQLIKMLPGDFVKVNNNLPQKEVAPQEKVLAWTQAKLIFENTAMIEAAKTISDHYGVKVILDKNVEEKKISGILPNDSLDVLLKALEATMNFQITRKDKEIKISKTKP
jgi:ferric-dicitrate binding protein FerR (iron transport regulator)